MPRIYPRVKVRMKVRCQSERSGVPVDRIVIHDTEGANLPNSIKDLLGLGGFFDHIETQASSHVANDSDGYSARYVPDGRKAWHCAEDNSRSLGIEQIGFASQHEWPAKQVRETARWVALWSKLHGIPIDDVHVVTHASLGAAGGGHHDPGPNYPMRRMRRLARVYKRLMLRPHRKV